MLAQLTQVTKFFDIQSGRAQKVLGGIDLAVDEADTLAIVGSSGSGKSTLLNILGTLDKPTTGVVELFGQSIGSAHESDLAALRARKIGFIFQMHHLLPQLSAVENVLIPILALPASARAGKEERARKLLDRVGLGEHIHKRPSQLSGGERQRVAVVRSLINEPQLVLADEPTGSLDEQNAHELVELLAELNRETGIALVMVTHDMALARQMERVARLKNGLLEWEKAPASA